MSRCRHRVMAGMPWAREGCGRAVGAVELGEIRAKRQALACEGRVGRAGWRGPAGAEAGGQQHPAPRLASCPSRVCRYSLGITGRNAAKGKGRLVEAGEGATALVAMALVAMALGAMALGATGLAGRGVGGQGCPLSRVSSSSALRARPLP